MWVHERHVPGRIVLRLGQCLLEVNNRGTPIPSDVLPWLLLPMQRGVSTHDKSSRSVGLGLYIVDQIVRAHRGRIEVTSTDATGTTLTVRLPRTPPAA